MRGRALPAPGRDGDRARGRGRAHEPPDDSQAEGWEVEQIEDVPALADAVEMTVKLWLGDGLDAFPAMVAREAEPGANAVFAAFGRHAPAMPPDVVARALQARVTICRAWSLLLDRYAALILPVSGELPFADDLDVRDFDRVMRAQLVQVGLPAIGVPGLTVSTGVVGATTVGCASGGGRFSEDLCLLAGEVIEAGGAPPAPIDPG